MRILWGSCLALGLVLSGCGKKKDDAKGDTGKTGDTAKKGDAGGGGATADALVGKWTLDKDAAKKAMMTEVRKQPGMENATEDHAMVKMQLAVLDSISMDFEVKADGTWAGKGTSPMAEVETMSGTWKKVGGEYEMTMKMGGDAEAGEQTGTAKIEGGKLSLVTPGGTLVFKRA